METSAVNVALAATGAAIPDPGPALMAVSQTLFMVMRGSLTLNTVSASTRMMTPMTTTVVTQQPQQQSTQRRRFRRYCVERHPVAVRAASSASSASSCMADDAG
jgi:hypothetical protein